ncbi:MAG: alpha/beta fold hydrolase [Pseudomonadota bacterium]
MTLDVQCSEAQCTVRELTYVYKHWRSAQAVNHATVLALHGWLDNANSFDVLAPLLVSQCDVDVIALDMAGHGKSQHRHIQGAYNIWDDLLELNALIDALGLDQPILLGHSRGAMVATLLAASLPEITCQLIVLDGMLAMPVPSEEAPKQLAKHLRQHSRSTHVMPHYATVDEAISARCKAAGMEPQQARGIVERGLIEVSDGRFEWRSDARVTRASAMKLNEVQNAAFYQTLSVPTLVLLAQEGFGPWMASALAETPGNQCVQMESLAGGHHFHLDPVHAGVIVNRIHAFLKMR